MVKLFYYFWRELHSVGTIIEGVGYIWMLRRENSVEVRAGRSAAASRIRAGEHYIVLVADVVPSPTAVVEVVALGSDYRHVLQLGGVDAAVAVEVARLDDGGGEPVLEAAEVRGVEVDTGRVRG